MTSTAESFTPVIALEDDFGLVYLVENPQQFWSELEDLLNFSKGDIPTLSLLDSTLKRYLALCAAYHELYLQSPLQLEHACELLLNSELFAFHSERMCEILVEETRTATNPHSQFVFYNVLLSHGRRRTDFFRLHKRWNSLMPLLMDHILVEMDPDTEDTYYGAHSMSSGVDGPVPIPIEAKLRSLSVRLLYEVCRVQKLSVQDLKIFDENFIDYLFDLVEQTREMSDETFNYSVIKLIVALNEQFMVASLSTQGSELLDQTSPTDQSKQETSKNRVLRVLMRRLNFTKTFGENMIFMLNRAQRTPEDSCMQLLVLKILYLLFTTPGTSEYFYTNDLCVLVDVFLRELVDLDEDSESLRHTYLRVLHPLLSKTQLKSTPYKRPQIVRCLESLVSNSSIREINPTTKRLVERCLGGEWCVQLRRKASSPSPSPLSSAFSRETSPDHDSVVSTAQARSSLLSVPSDGGANKSKALKSVKSVEHMNGKNAIHHHRSKASPRGLENLRRPSNSSTISLTGVAAATVPTSALASIPKRTGTADLDGSFSGRSLHYSRSPTSEADEPRSHMSVDSLPSISPPSSLVAAASLPSSPDSGLDVPKQRRAPPPPPKPKRRKPPAIPVGRTNGGATITAIQSSSSR